MIGTRKELVESWLVKANHDLLSARELARAAIPLLDTASYHCQQAGEKALKAYLLCHDVRFEKTHDLEVLIEQAVEIDSAFSSCVDAARILTPLAVEFRYPGEYMAPEPDEYSEAFAAAEYVYNFVIERLPEGPCTKEQ
jgi:HEPN domain-containing protein